MENINVRKSTSVRQLDVLIAFMEAHTDFATGRLRSKEGRALATRLWNQCADIINSEGVGRTPKDWSKVWNDYKCRVRAKLAQINRGYSGTGGGPNRAPQLSPLEDRVAALIGRDVGPLTGVRQDPEIEIQYVSAEEMAVEQDAESPAANSPILNISLIHPSPATSPATQDLSRTLSLESEHRDSAPSAGHNQTADQGTTAPQTGGPRLRQPRPTRPRVRGRPRFVHQSNTAALDEARATIARIEEMRTRTEELVATATLNMSNAMTGIASSMTSISNAITTMAESLRTFVAHRVNPDE